MAYAPQNGPAGDKNAHRRSIIRIIRPINGTFVGRIQYAPTQGHKNAPRFMHTTTVKQSNAPHFPPPTSWHPLKAAYFSGNTIEHAPTAIIFRPSG